MSDELIAGLGGALIGAVLTSIFAWLLHRNEQVSSMKDELRKAITVLIELREDFQTRVMAIVDPQQKEAAGSFVNTKRMIYLEAAETLVSKIPKYVSSSEYNILAYEHMAESNFNQAARYYLKAVSASRSLFNKVSALRSLAAFYYGQGSHRDFNLGRKYFQEAVDLLKNPTDPWLIYTQGFTYETWGLHELSNGFKLEGEQMISRARKYYTDLPPNDPLKKQAVEWLEIKLKRLAEPESPTLVAPVSTAAQITQTTDTT